MMNVPLADMSGKSPMKTVWLLISPVVLLMNSAVTNIGAEYVMSLSLHSSAEYLDGSNRWSRNDRDIVPEKSSIGLISSKISSSPDCSGTSLRPASLAAWTRVFHLSLPSSQSNDSVCRASRSGTFRGSVIRAKDTRRGPRFVAEALRDAANRGPSELVAELSPHARQTPHGVNPREAKETPRTSECSANGQCSQWLHCLSTVRQYEVHLAPQHPLSGTKRQALTARFGRVSSVMDTTRVRMCKCERGWVSQLFRPVTRRRRRGPPGGSFAVCCENLLDRDGGAGALQGAPGLVRGFLVDLLKHGLRRAVHQVLGLLQAQAGQRTHLLDDLDLLVTRRLKDDVELVLLLGRLGLGATRAGRRRRRGGRDRSGGLDVERLLESLHELRQLKEGHLLERVEQVGAAELRHDRFPSFLSPGSVSRCRACPPAPPAPCPPRPRAWRAARRRAAPAASAAR